MPRRREVPKRIIAPDPKYKNTLVSKFVNGLMRKGKKSISRRIFYDAMEIV
ncbi:MAG: 30S ribosomal protein S7, partial [Thermodesulfobacteriota bacterium]|nr:30S ribosomal protein S7 [Thermodesulfobacteriota bacterium]